MSQCVLKIEWWHTDSSEPKNKNNHFYKIGFASENVLRLKLLEEGVSRETITIIGILFSPLLFVLPFAIKRYVHSEKPLDLILNTYSLK